jgi:hypothetical protein
MTKVKHGGVTANQMMLPLPELMQSMPTKSASPIPQGTIVIPVDPTFEASQGLRTVMTSRVVTSGGPLRVIFDGRFLELAEQNVTSQPDPEAPYLGPQGCILNLAVFPNILRCYGALRQWSHEERLQLNTECWPPRSGTRVRALWDVLDVEALFFHIQRPPGPIPLFEYQSRYVSPILLIKEGNKSTMIGKCHEWIASLADRLGSRLQNDLIVAVPEIVTNLIKYGFAGGGLIISVWPTGQVEMIWMNRVDHLPNWPSENTATGLANAILNRDGGGSGMAYIFDDLLPHYNGTLAVNHHGNSVIFRAGRYVEIYGQDRRTDLFLPRSILFTLELFARELRERSKYEANNTSSTA